MATPCLLSLQPGHGDTGSPLLCFSLLHCSEVTSLISWVENTNKISAILLPLFLSAWTSQVGEAEFKDKSLVLPFFKSSFSLALARWLSRLEHHTIPPKVAGLIPGPGTSLGYRFDPWSGRLPVTVSLTSMVLSHSLYRFLPHHLRCDGKPCAVSSEARAVVCFRGSAQSRCILCFSSGFGHHLGEDEGFGL